MFVTSCCSVVELALRNPHLDRNDLPPLGTSCALGETRTPFDPRGDYIALKPSKGVDEKQRTKTVAALETSPTKTCPC